MQFCLCTLKSRKIYRPQLRNRICIQNVQQKVISLQPRVTALIHTGRGWASLKAHSYSAKANAKAKKSKNKNAFQ